LHLQEYPLFMKYRHEEALELDESKDQFLKFVSETYQADIPDRVQVVFGQLLQVAAGSLPPTINRVTLAHLSVRPAAFSRDVSIFVASVQLSMTHDGSGIKINPQNARLTTMEMTISMEAAESLVTYLTPKTASS
ncbi:hypothetical protein BGZ65_007104, partial [Modicella reniformis]